jgi:sulfatase maturation enzyme AslB (radical SAM superfamily)
MDQQYSIDTIVKVVELDQALSGGCPYDFSFFLDKLADPDRVVSDMALKSIMALMPMASLPIRWEEPMPVEITRIKNIPDWIYQSCEGWGKKGDFVDRCVQKLQTLSDKDVEDFIDRLALLQGCHDELPKRFSGIELHKLGALYKKKALQIHNIQYPKQICFSPTLRCQLNCPYCVSAGILTGKDKTMPLKAAIRLVDWGKQHNVKRICFAGGEPTLYPHFANIVNYIRKSGMEVILATNGLGDPHTTTSMIDNQISSVTLHLTDEILKTDHLHMYTRTALELLKAKVNVAMRINLLSPDDDPNPYIKTAHKLGFRDLRVAVPVPNFERHNYYVSTEYLSGFGELIGKCVTEAEKSNIRVGLAKPFPLCMLPERVAKSFLSNGSMISNCQVHMQGFSHNIVVHPDLSFSPCLALNNSSNSKILDYNGVIDAAQVYLPDIKKLSEKPPIEECRHCPLAINGRCVGVCLSYRLNRGAASSK